MSLNWPFLTGWDGEAEESDGLPFIGHGMPSVDVVNEFYLPFQVGNYLELIGASYGSSTASAALSALRMLTGQAAGVGSAAGELSATKSLQGSSVGAAQVAAWLSAVAGLVGQANGVSGATGELSAAKPLSGSAAGSGQTTALLSALKAFAGQSTGSSVTDAILEFVTGGATYLELIGASTGQGSADGTLSVLLPLAGASSGQAGATARLSALVSLKGGAVGASLNHAELSALKSLIGSTQGQASISALLDLRDIYGSLGSVSSQANSVGVANSFVSTVTPTQVLTWTVSPEEEAAYVETETVYMGIVE